MSHEMDTANRGKIVSQSDSNRAQGPMHRGDKAFEQPADFTPGCAGTDWMDAEVWY